MAKAHENFHYSLIVSDEDTGFTGRKGFIDAECVNELVTSRESWKIHYDKVSMELFGKILPIMDEILYYLEV